MKYLWILIALFLGGTPAGAQTAPGFAGAASDVQRRLEESVAELSRLRAELAEQKIPLNQRLADLELQLSQARDEYQSTTRLLDSRSLDLANLGTQIKTRREELSYISNLLAEYIRNFESRLHIAETQRHGPLVDEALLAPENSNLTEAEIFAAQTQVLHRSLDRLIEAGSGVRFDGNAVDSEGVVKAGTFVLVGHTALFRSADGQVAGIVEHRTNSHQPTVVPFSDPLLAAQVAQVVQLGAGTIPFDPTMGDAQKIAETEETLLEHIQKGGPVMFPILAMGAAALTVALIKWIGLTLVRVPRRKQLQELYAAVARGDDTTAVDRANSLPGPVGEMLRSGVAQMRAPRELIEEVMYETVLTTKLRLQRFLPFVAICAASAPLLGLLGTVTGIINTFKLLTVFGSGDVKSLSGGISEALITTEFGLIVAIPSLLLHSFLSRKANGFVSRMDTAAVAFANAVSVRDVTPPSPEPEPEPEEPAPVHRSGPKLARAT